MAQDKDTPQLNGAADRFVSAALHSDGSLITRDQPVCSPIVQDDLYDHYITHEHQSKDTFFVKFRRQLEAYGGIR